MIDAQDDNISWLDMLYPLGKDRWFKIRILDQEKCAKAFHINMSGTTNEKEKEQGYEIRSIGCREEYVPQVWALMELKDTVVGQLFAEEYSYIKQNIKNAFDNKIAELKQQTIVNAPLPEG